MLSITDRNLLCDACIGCEAVANNEGFCLIEEREAEEWFDEIPGEFIEDW